jgi:hypothetical protein
MDFKENVWGRRPETYCFRQDPVAGSFELGDMISGFIECKEFHECLSHFYVVKNSLNQLSRIVSLEIYLINSVIETKQVSVAV